MFAISRIRSVLAVLVAAACVAVAVGSVIPDAQARPNDGRYKKSQEAKRKKLQNKCDDWKNSYDNLGVLFDAAHEQHDLSGMSNDLIALSDIQDQAAKAGCGWAKRVVLPTPPLPEQTAPPPPVSTATR